MTTYTGDSVNQLFEQFGRQSVMVIGDVMIDSYLWGKVNRISPEAPVPVVSVSNRTNRLGGAANVALNLKAMGANTLLCSVIGNDDRALLFKQLLAENELSADGIIRSEKRITTTKFRVIGNNAQMLRVDEETEAPLDEAEQQFFMERITQLLSSRSINAIIFQDYDKGVITPEIIRHVVGLANERNIPVAVDPKKRNFMAYDKVTLFKPNLKELSEGLGEGAEKFDIENIRQMVRQIHQRLNAAIVLVTLSEKGIFISRQTTGGQYSDEHIEAHVRSIADVSGAGDTVISLATLGLAAGLSDHEVAAVSNLAGGQVCESVGVVPVDPGKLKKEMLTRRL